MRSATTVAVDDGSDEYYDNRITKGRWSSGFNASGVYGSGRQGRKSVFMFGRPPPPEYYV